MSLNEYIEFFKDLSVVEWGGYAYQTLFFIGMIIIFILEKEKKQRNLLIWYPLTILIFIYNPATLFICRKIFGEADLTAYYCRLFLILPISFIIVKGFVILLERCENKMVKMLMTFMIALIIILSGHSVYSEQWYIKAQNINKVPDDVLQICSLVSEEDKNIKIMVPNELTPYIRQIDASIQMPYGRDQATEEIAIQVSSIEPDTEYIVKYGKENDCDYVVCVNSETIVNNFESFGCMVEGYTEHYVVIKLSSC